MSFGHVTRWLARKKTEARRRKEAFTQSSQEKRMSVINGQRRWFMEQRRLMIMKHRIAVSAALRRPKELGLMVPDLATGGPQFMSLKEAIAFLKAHHPEEFEAATHQQRKKESLN